MYASLLTMTNVSTPCNIVFPTRWINFPLRAPNPGIVLEDSVVYTVLGVKEADEEPVEDENVDDSRKRISKYGWDMVGEKTKAPRETSAHAVQKEVHRLVTCPATGLSIAGRKIEKLTQVCAAHDLKHKFGFLLVFQNS
jgi:hypothetical protein